MEDERGPTARPPGVGPRTRWTWWPALACVTLGVLTLVVFAPVARLMAARAPTSPVAPNALTRLPGVGADEAARSPASPGVRSLPAGLPEGPAPRTAADLRPLAERALGASGAQVLDLLLSNRYTASLRETARGHRLGFAPAPYRYPVMEALLREAPGHGNTPAAVELGAALIVLAGRVDDSYYLTDANHYSNAAPAAYAVLRAAEATGGCDVKLDLLLLVAADDQPRDVVVRQAAADASAACGDDPTPGWVLAQFQSQRAVEDPDDERPGDPVPGDAQTRYEKTMAGMLDRFPGSADVWAAAGDAEVRSAAKVEDDQPFTARAHFRTAVAAYRRAAALASTPVGRREMTVGLAQALTGVGDPAKGAHLLEDLPQDPGSSGLRLEQLATAQEAAHDFAGASATERTLARLGTNAFPDGSGLSASSVLSTGAERFLLLSVSLQPGPGGAGGGNVTDAAFIPRYREMYDGLAETQAACPEWSWRRDAVVAGDPESALREWPADRGVTQPTIPELPSSSSRGGGSCGSYDTDRLRDVARAEAGVPTTLSKKETDDLADHRQNMWRWAGRLTQAERVVRQWLSAASATDPLPMLRLGEIEFLRHHYDDAAATFAATARRTRLQTYDNDLGVDQARLDQAASLLRAGEPDQAAVLLRPMADRDLRDSLYWKGQNTNYEAQAGFALVSYHSSALLADSESEQGRMAEAEADYADARGVVPVLESTQVEDYRVERIDDNQATADVALGRPQAAQTHAARALAADPHNPVFLFTAASAAESAGDLEAAIGYGRGALANDAGQFAAANNLGVDLARQHQYAAASAALRRSVDAAPRYALGWFNLGVVESRRGVGHLLTSQGALARAFALDPELADRARVPTRDTVIYRTGLDLSKPLPPHWSFASLQRRAPATSAGLLALVLLGLALARGTARSDLAKDYLEPVTARLSRVPLISRPHAPVYAVAATALVFWIPTVRHPGAGLVATVTGVVGVLALSALVIVARVVVARRAGQPSRQESWGPGMLFGVAASVAGAPWAPLPVVRSDSDDTGTSSKVNAAAPIAVTLLAAVLFVESAALEVPLTRSWALVALIMAASMLLPVEPLDGARIGKVGLVASVGVVAGAALVLLGLA